MVQFDLSFLSSPAHSSFVEFIDTSLNEAQKEAVFHNNGSIVVIAGAGSGKTRLITSRIAHLLLEKKVPPIQIVALTFTNKAAQEMKERVIFFTHGSQEHTPFIGTFHSYCLYLLRMHAHLLPFPTFSIMDEEDKKSLLSKLLKKSPLHKKYTPQAVSHHISRFKNSVSESESHFALEHPQLFEIMQEYEKEKRNSNCFDFDDLLLEVLHLFKKYPDDVKAAHHERVRHILVDEYQDTNTIQHTLLKEMSLGKKGKLTIDSMCVVGDEDQSIYSWRGATVDNIIDFKKEFKDTRLIKIEQNYRSKQPILSIANNLIRHNNKRNEKKLWSDKKGSDCVRALKCLSSYQEAEIVARLCKLLCSSKKLSSTAILYRTHFQSRVLEEALLRHSIPYTIIGGIRFYERKEIKDLLSYLRLIANPYDKVACARIINCPLRGLGEKFQETFLEIWHNEPLLDLQQIIQKVQTEKLFSVTKLEELKRFGTIFKKHSSNSSTTETLADIISSTEYIDYLKKTYEQQEAEERQKNIRELLNAAHFFANQGKTTVRAFLEEVSLLQEQFDKHEENEQNIVTLMTLHAAKGLEFDNVIITGLEENILPSTRSIDTQDNLEEERRLLYVGITRARNRLLFTYTHFRQSYGQMETQIPSRFLQEISKEFCKFEQADRWHYYEIDTYLSQWLGVQPQATPDVFVFSKPKQVDLGQSQCAKKTTLATEKESSLKNVSSQTSFKKSSSIGGFRKHQTVNHDSFGLGVIQDLEEKKNKTIAHVRFKAGLKKVETSFLQRV